MKKRCLQNLFICSSVFQVFNIANLCASNFELGSSDVLLLDYGTDIDKYLDLNFMKRTFNEVKVIKHKRKNKSISVYINVLKEILKSIILCNNWKIEYRNIFISGTEIYSKIYAYRYMDHFENLFYIEDGLESYDAVLDEKSKKVQDTVFQVFYKERPLNLCKALYLYEPSFAINNTYNKVIFNIPKVKKDTCVAKIIKNIFLGNTIEIKQKVIFLEAWFNDLEKYMFQVELLQIIADIIEFENIGIKKHPNNINNKDIYEDNLIIEGISSFELNNLYYSLNEKVLISIISTACLTPKMIYDEEPYVIFLYKIFLSKYEFSEWISTEEVILKIKRNYRVPSKIMIPETISELKGYLNSINIMIGKE